MSDLEPGPYWIRMAGCEPTVGVWNGHEWSLVGTAIRVSPAARVVVLGGPLKPPNGTEALSR